MVRVLLELCRVEGVGLTPASHRAGGATTFYHLFEDTEWIRWRGRWAQQKQLDFYIQEVGAINLMESIPKEGRDTIKHLRRVLTI